MQLKFHDKVFSLQRQDLEITKLVIPQKRLAIKNWKKITQMNVEINFFSKTFALLAVYIGHHTLRRKYLVFIFNNSFSLFLFHE